MNIPLKRRSPVRYFSETVEIGFWEAVKRFLKHGKWSWYKVVFISVYEGDTSYDQAPYEESIIEIQ